jgi:hypothetical protein
MDARFSHGVTFEKSRGIIRIDRVYPNGDRVLYTEVKLSSPSDPHRKDVFADTARALGEALLLDAPDARDLFGLN